MYNYSVNNNNKELKSLTRQMAIFYLIPSILCIFAVIAYALNEFVLRMDGFKSFMSILLTPIAILSFIGGYLMAFNTVGFRKVGPPMVDVININVANSYVSASSSREYSSAQRITIVGNLIVAGLCFLLVAAFGWLFFIMYKKDKFLFKIKMMAYKTDEAEELIKTRSTDIQRLGETIHYMTQYVEVYANSGDKIAGSKMLERAKKLHALMQQAASQSSHTR